MSERCIGCDININDELTPLGNELLEYEGQQTESNRRLLGGGSWGRSGTGDIQRAEETYEELNLPEDGCPHQPYDESVDRCIFHLTEEQKRERGVTEADIRDAFVKRVNESGSEQQSNKAFINATIPKLDLGYRELNSKDNRPIDLRFSEVGEVRFDQTVLHETMKLDYSEVDSLQWRDSELLGGVTAREIKVDDSAIEIEGNHIENVFDFSGSELRGKVFEIEENNFSGDVILNNAEVELKPPGRLVSGEEANVSFNNNRFRRRLDCRSVVLRSDPNGSSGTDQPAVGNIRVTMRRCEFDGKVSFKRAEIGTWTEQKTQMGGSFIKQPVFDDEISEVSFKRGDFSAVTVEFGAMDVAGELDISGGNFDRADVNMSGLRTEGELDLSATNYSEKDVYMNDIEIDGDCKFEDATFQNNSFSLEDATIEADAKFDDVILDGSMIKFHDVTVKGGFEMADSRVTGKDIDFSDLSTEGTISLDRATISGQDVDFSGLDAGSLACISANIKCKTIRFDDSEFEGKVTFENARLDTNKTTFNSATFAGETCFSQIRFNGSVWFKNASFEGVETEAIDFSGINAKNARLQFLDTSTGRDGDQAETKGQATVIDFSGSVVLSGQFRQPATPGTYYDFSEATVGDIDLMFHPDHKKEGQLFNYFRFYETEFDGFDFSNSRYRKELKENDWRLDTVASTPGARTEQVGGHSSAHRNAAGGPFSYVKNTARRYWWLVTRGSSPESEYDRLESTYRKAKISADENGDSEASSKFFQKELLFRRRTHGHQVWLRADGTGGPGVSVWERLKRAWLWLTNWVLWVTSGYGERPKRVILSSIAVIILFTGLHELAWFASGSTRPAQLEGAAGSLILSAEMFTAIILGGSGVTATPIRIISVIEGFVGSFFIALFVLTITRSVRR